MGITLVVEREFRPSHFFHVIRQCPGGQLLVYPLRPLGQGIANGNTIIISPQIEQIVLAGSPKGDYRL